MANCKTCGAQVIEAFTAFGRPLFDAQPSKLGTHFIAENGKAAHVRGNSQFAQTGRNCKYPRYIEHVCQPEPQVKG